MCLLNTLFREQKLTRKKMSMDNKTETTPRLTGLVAATYAPMHADGSLNLEMVAPIVDYLVSVGITGLYVNGSTGEGVSMTSGERCQVAEAYVQANAGRLPVIVQVGHNSLAESAELAAHAQAIGADVISACSPSYFKPDSVGNLVDCMAETAAGAPDLPFYYYHIPRLTGAAIDMLAFLDQAEARIPTIRGVKYSDTTAFEFQACLEHRNRRFDVLWGCDEMLLSALAVGAKGAVGSTYNFAAPLYNRVIEAYNAGDLAEAQRCQLLSVKMINVFARYPFHSAMKAVMGLIGLECGPRRLPHVALTPDQVDSLRADLDEIGFLDWGTAQ